MSVRCRPSSWMQFSNHFFKCPWHGPTTGDRSDEFPDGWLPSNHSTYGVCECKYAIANTPPPPKKKSHVERSGDWGGPTARLRNGKWGAREKYFEQWSFSGLQCALWHRLVENTHWHSLFFFGAVPSPPAAYLLSTTRSKDVSFPCVILYFTHTEAFIFWTNETRVSDNR